MKKVLFTLLCACSVLHPAAAQDGAIYRCGNEYTNTATAEQMKNCKLVTGGNVTVLQSAKPATKASGSAKTAASAPLEAQRQRDNDSRAILESELKKTQARLNELNKDYNNGEPEKRGDEARNYQKYQDRVAELKANIARAQSDIDGLTREISRLPVNN
jgi:chromosome segregation ATPase